jgi:hypothetical protein
MPGWGVGVVVAGGLGSVSHVGVGGVPWCVTQATQCRAQGRPLLGGQFCQCLLSWPAKFCGATLPGRCVVALQQRLLQPSTHTKTAPCLLPDVSTVFGPQITECRVTVRDMHGWVQGRVHIQPEQHLPVCVTAGYRWVHVLGDRVLQLEAAGCALPGYRLCCACRHVVVSRRRRICQLTRTAGALTVADAGSSVLCAGGCRLHVDSEGGLTLQYCLPWCQNRDMCTHHDGCGCTSCWHASHCHSTYCTVPFGQYSD